MHDVKSKEDHHHRWFSFCFYRHTPSRLKAISYSSHRTTAKAHRHFPIITPKSETQPQQGFEAIGTPHAGLIFQNLHLLYRLLRRSHTLPILGKIVRQSMRIALLPEKVVMRSILTSHQGKG